MQGSVGGAVMSQLRLGRLAEVLGEQRSLGSCCDEGPPERVALFSSVIAGSPLLLRFL